MLAPAILILNMPPYLEGLVWVLLLIGPGVFAQRRVHREIQAIFLLLTRRPEIAMALFAWLFLPGVLLHELSHFLAARFLLVRTGRVSILPRLMENGRIQLGFVETAETDWIRDTLIGAAPLIAGGIFVAYAGLTRLGLLTWWSQVSQSDWEGLVASLPLLYSVQDFWLWFYLTIAVSGTMFPSPSDRRSWLPLGLTVVVIIGLSLLAGAGPWLEANLAPLLQQAFWSIAIVLAISLLVQALIWFPLWGFRRVLSRVSGWEVA